MGTGELGGGVCNVHPWHRACKPGQREHTTEVTCMEDQPGGTSSPVACRYDANAPTTEGTLDEQMEYMAPESQTDQATKAGDLGNQGRQAAGKARSKGEEVAGQAREQGQETIDQARIKANRMSHIARHKASRASQLPPTNSANRPKPSRANAPAITAEAR